MKRKTYKTKRLTLRPYRSSDYKSWAWAYKNILPKQAKYDWIPPAKLPVNKVEFQKIVRRHSKMEKEDRCYVWAIFEKSTGALLGHVDIAILTRDNLQVANLGYRVINRYWRQGFAKEALNHIIPRAFNDLRLNRFEAVIDLDNRPSIALTKAIGLKRECVRKKFYYQDGAWADQVVYVAIRQDFGLPKLHPFGKKK